MKVVLASTSKYRVALLSRLGFPFETVAPDFDEAQHKKTGMTPADLAIFLAQGKAVSLVDKFPGAAIIGSDQVGVLGKEYLGKPGTKEKAVAQLLKLSGKTHTLHCGLAVCFGGKTVSTCVSSHLTMVANTEEALRRYVGIDNPIDCAGSYKTEKLGISLFEKIQTDDPTAVEGLPLMKLSEILRTLVGLKLP